MFLQRHPLQKMRVRDPGVRLIVEKTVLQDAAADDCRIESAAPKGMFVKLAQGRHMRREKVIGWRTGFRCNWAHGCKPTGVRGIIRANPVPILRKFRNAKHSRCEEWSADRSG